jgi:hypothetical protein
LASTSTKAALPTPALGSATRVPAVQLARHAVALLADVEHDAVLTLLGEEGDR